MRGANLHLSGGELRKNRGGSYHSQSQMWNQKNLHWQKCVIILFKKHSSCLWTGSWQGPPSGVISGFACGVSLPPRSHLRGPETKRQDWPEWRVCHHTFLPIRIKQGCPSPFLHPKLMQCQTQLTCCFFWKISCYSGHQWLGEKPTNAAQLLSPLLGSSENSVTLIECQSPLLPLIPPSSSLPPCGFWAPWRKGALLTFLFPCWHRMFGKGETPPLWKGQWVSGICFGPEGFRLHSPDNLHPQNIPAKPEDWVGDTSLHCLGAWLSSPIPPPKVAIPS